ncbi:MAG: TIGR04282 family arsenosugar biosynthesis glycosyltransferase [Snowella sp.]|nr:TIGR04282 family arsenosugar biosynthesis glycosyltransferase [Snowella sp.]
MSQQRLILFTRYPVPGQTKTRLIPLLGTEGAAQLQRQMTEFTLVNLYPLWQSANVEIFVYYSGGDRDLIRAWLDPVIEPLNHPLTRLNGELTSNHLRYQEQETGDLGQRMQGAFADAFRAGIERVVIIGTDCPGLTPALIQEALTALNNDEVVLGPAKDGGYYLIGLNRPLPMLFQNIPWGSDRVFAQTQAILEQHHLTYYVLKTLTDIDRPEDLWLWEKRNGDR